MILSTSNGHANGNGVNGHSHTNGHSHMNGHSEHHTRAHPQTSHSETTVDPTGFYGKIRAIYADKVLKTQLEQLKQQGSYDAFKLNWHPAYDVRRLKGARTRQDGIPPSLFWESDVGKWIEAVCYFLGSEGHDCAHKAEFEASVQELVDMIEKAQQPDGYLNIYFTVVDPEGRFQNFRDMHEMYNAGHLLEAALAHYHYTHSRQFLDVMIRNVECFAKALGPDSNQLHAYPGHPEFELAVLRLYSLTKDPNHLEFGEYLLSERGVKRADQNDESFFVHEAKKRDDYIVPHTMDSIEGVDYHQAHLPLHDQDNILGHSVRALYLTTAAADLGGDFLSDAQRLLSDCINHKMYATGGIGSEPRFEGFHPAKYRLPQSTGEGGCYAETCASIACMMTSERVLSWGLNSQVRDTMELCLLNAVLGGGSLNGKQFSYANKHATWGDEVATRNDWFEVCCCPPNLSRTLGMLGGYTWSVNIDESNKTIHLDVYLFVTASRSIHLPDGSTATAKLSTEMPWEGQVTLDLSAGSGWTWTVRLPRPDYAENIQISTSHSIHESGFAVTTIDKSGTIDMTFDLPVRLLASHPLTGQDTLTVSRGPIVYTAESYDNPTLDKSHKHFEGVGITSTTEFHTSPLDIEGIPMLGLKASDRVFVMDKLDQRPSCYAVSTKFPARKWTKVEEGLTLVPWFARANRGGAGHVRTALLRAD